MIAMSVSFWLPVLALIGVLFFLLHAHFHSEATDQAKLGLKGAKAIYAERMHILERLVPQLASRPDVKQAFNEQDGERLQTLLLERQEMVEFISFFIAVDNNHRLITRRGDSLGEVIQLGDMLTPVLASGQLVTSTRLVSNEFLMQENPDLANHVGNAGLVQFVAAPVWQHERIQGALVFGVLLTADTSLGDSIFERLGVDFVIFGGKPAENVTLHAAASLPRSLWVMGESLPSGLGDNILLGKPYYGLLDVNGTEAVVAFEPLKDSLNRTIGAIGVSSLTNGMASMAFAILVKGLVVAAILGLLIALIVTHFIRGDISRPLDILVAAMERFGKGELDISVDLQTGDQFEQLGSGFNHMAESVFKREERLMKHNTVAKLLMSTLNLEELLDQTLRVVVEVSESQVGAIYLFDRPTNSLICQARYGTKYDLEPLQLGEGYPGRAAQDQATIIEPFASSMTEATIKNGFSEGEPKVVAYIPLVYKERLLGVLMLGTITHFQDDELHLIGYLADQISIALDNAIMHHHIQELSVTDGLTGLYNRRYVNERLDESWARATRHGEPLSIILADIDNFKSVNDTYGHDRGDEVICRMAEVYRTGARQEDVVARYGGEEFLVVLANTEVKDALMLAERICQMAREQEYDWADHTITLSIGVATFPTQAAASYTELVRMADHALYKAKLTGKDQAVVYDASMESVVK